MRIEEETETLDDEAVEVTHKVCPYCAENIKTEAVVCRYCRRDLLRSARVDVLKRRVFPFVWGFVALIALRFVVALGAATLYVYALRVSSTVELPWLGPVDWIPIAVMALALLPASAIVGYCSKEWGWISAGLLEPVWVIIVQSFAMPALENPPYYMYTDWKLLVFGQLMPGIFLGMLGGTAGELARHRMQRQSAEDRRHKGTAVQDTFSYPNIDGLQDGLKWYVRWSPTIVLRVPMLLFFCGALLLSLVSQAPYILEIFLGVPSINAGLGRLIAFPVFMLQVLFLIGPAIVLPLLWSNMSSLSRSSRVAISVTIFPVWAAVFLTLILVGWI